MVVTYTETSEWVLERRFLRTDTGRKSDGSHDLTMTTYHAPSGGYPLWLFSSSGATITLAPGVWNETTRTLTWKSPAGATVSYESRCLFPTDGTRRCSSWAKDWKGTLLLDQEITAVRRP